VHQMGAPSPVAMPVRFGAPGVARAAVAAGADVLIEKPLAASLGGVANSLAQVERGGQRVRVVCNMRLHPAVDALRRALPRVGRPLFACAQYGNYLPEMRSGPTTRRSIMRGRTRAPRRAFGPFGPARGPREREARGAEDPSARKDPSGVPALQAGAHPRCSKRGFSPSFPE